MFCLKISAVICVQKYSHWKSVHGKGGEKDGSLVQGALAFTCEVQGSNLLTVTCLDTPSWGIGGLEAKAKAFKKAQLAQSEI